MRRLRDGWDRFFFTEAPVLGVPLAAFEALLESQPYELTGGQRRSLEQSLEDLAKPRAMIRRRSTRSRGRASSRR